MTSTGWSEASCPTVEWHCLKSVLRHVKYSREYLSTRDMGHPVITTLWREALLTILFPKFPYT